MSDAAQRAEPNLRINRTGTAATAAATAMIASMAFMLQAEARKPKRSGVEHVGYAAQKGIDGEHVAVRRRHAVRVR